MPVVDVRESPEQEVEKSRSGTTERRSFLRTFSVLCSDPINDDESVAIAAIGIPRIGDAHPSNLLVPCVMVKASRLQGARTLWLVQCRYELNWSAIGGADPIDPLATPLEFDGGSLTITEPVDHDGAGVLLANSLGELYDPPCTDEFRDHFLTVVRVEGTPPLVNQIAYEGSLNGVAISVFGVNVGRGQGFIASMTYAGFIATNVLGVLQWFYRVRYHFLFRISHPPLLPPEPEKVWFRRVANTSFYHIVNAKRKRITDADIITLGGGTPGPEDSTRFITQPWPITQNGDLIPLGQPSIFRTHPKNGQRYINWGPLGMF